MKSLLLLSRANTFTHGACIAGALRRVGECVAHGSTLYVAFTHQLLNAHSHAHLFNATAYVYAHSEVVCGHLDVRVLVDHLRQPNDYVMLDGRAHSVYIDADTDDMYSKLAHALATYKQSVHLDTMLTSDKSDDSPLPPVFMPRASQLPPQLGQFGGVVLGGTFDHIHNGHKILLTSAAMLARTQFTCGVTHPHMLTRKVLAELIEPLDTRIDNVQQFIHDIDSTLNLKVVPITDPFGPSIVDTDLDCIVASSETLNGALAVNDRRTLNALASLHVYAIQLIDDERTVTSEECKVSSWKCRRALLGTLLRPVQRAKHAHTYVIGLTGGIASGKTHIADYCRQLGAHVIDCDRLGHDVYTVDTECYAKLINEFGTSIVELTTRAIDRRALGKIVFADKAKLERLNAIVWPYIRTRVEQQVRECHAPVAVVDAAVLLEAGWDSLVDEVWAAIVPAQEAVKRIMARNSLSEADAEMRLKAQQSNEKRVAAAHVVLCSLWEYEQTRVQVQRAWTLLMERIQNSR